MKKAISLILAVVLTVSLSACANRRDMMNQQTEENTLNVSFQRFTS